MTTLREAPVAVFGGWQVYRDSIRHDGACCKLTRWELTRDGSRWDAQHGRQALVQRRGVPGRAAAGEEGTR